MNLTRRTLVKLIGAAPAALPAARAAPALLSIAEPAAALTGAAAYGRSDAGPPHAAPSESRSPLSSALHAQVEDLRRQLEHEEYHAGGQRTDGIDHDIAALKSTSRAFKLVKQRERNRETYALARRVQKALGWG